ncbi:hypothetical protein GCM10010363_39230 [Streptomyces omiyaensis]|nr:hypothetical protein GCM10010363_39230 [Streptomyces omiyaensis]
MTFASSVIRLSLLAPDLRPTGMPGPGEHGRDPLAIRRPAAAPGTIDGAARAVPRARGAVGGGRGRPPDGAFG